MTLWVEDLACCGEPFAVGETIRWEVNAIEPERRHCLALVFGDDTAQQIDASHVPHEYQSGQLLTAAVRSIVATGWDWPVFGGDTRSLETIVPSKPVSVTRHEQTAANPSDTVDGLDCKGYIVEVEVLSGNSA